MLRLLVPLSVVVVLVACSDTIAPTEVPGPQAKAQVIHDRVVTPLTGLVQINECSGETITSDGTLTTTIHQMTNGSGGTRFSIHQTAKADGISDAGVRYNLILVTSANDADHATSDGSVLSVPFTLKYVGQGPSNNYYMRSLVHITTNADGEVTSYIDRTVFGCR